MSPQLVKILITAALPLHGVAHVRGFFELLPDAAAAGRRNTVQVRSWLLPFSTPRQGAVLASPFWLVSGAGFILASLSFWGIFMGDGPWRQISVASSVVSTLGVILFGGVWPGARSPRLSMLDVAIALSMNVVIMALLLAIGWPPLAMFGK